MAKSLKTCFVTDGCCIWSISQYAEESYGNTSQGKNSNHPPHYRQSIRLTVDHERNGVAAVFFPAEPDSTVVEAVEKAAGYLNPGLHLYTNGRQLAPWDASGVVCICRRKRS